LINAIFIFVIYINYILFQNILAKDGFLLTHSVLITLFHQLVVLAKSTFLEYFTLTKAEASSNFSAIGVLSANFFISFFKRSFGFSIHSNIVGFLVINNSISLSSFSTLVL